MLVQRKTITWKGSVSFGRVNEGRKDHEYGWGFSEVVVNSHLEALEGRVRLNRLRKLIPQVRDKRSK